MQHLSITRRSTIIQNRQIWTLPLFYRPTGWPKKLAHHFVRLNFTNRFSKLFHCQSQEKICNNTITKDPTTPHVYRYTTLWNVKCLKTNNWNAATVCPTQWRSPASAGWLSWIVDVDRSPGIPNNVIDWTKVWAVWGPHVRLDERDFLAPLLIAPVWSVASPA